MDLWKFEKMLADGGNLYFHRSDKFEDALEGTYSEKTFSFLKEKYREQHGETFSKNWETLHRGKDSINGYVNALRRNALVSCWHINESESSRMWEDYITDPDGFGIVIKSTGNRLIESLHINDNDKFFSIDIGEVSYINHKNEPVNINDILHAVFIKDIQYEWETELRAVIWDRPDNVSSQESQFITESNGKTVSIEHGGTIKVVLKKLIEEIRFSPTTPKEKIQDIQQKLSQSGLEIPINSSDFSK